MADYFLHRISAFFSNLVSRQIDAAISRIVARVACTPRLFAHGDAPHTTCLLRTPSRRAAPRTSKRLRCVHRVYRTAISAGWSVVPCLAAERLTCTSRHLGQARAGGRKKIPRSGTRRRRRRAAHTAAVSRTQLSLHCSPRRAAGLRRHAHGFFACSCTGPHAAHRTLHRCLRRGIG